MHFSSYQVVILKYLDKINSCIYNYYMAEINGSNFSIETVAKECIALRMRMINRAVSRLYDRALQPFGIRVSQMNILVLISKRGQSRQQDICRALFMDRSTVSRDVARMQARGWIDARPGEDARSSLLKVTPDGAALLEKVIPAWSAVQQKTTTIIGELQVVALDSIVSALRAQADG
jgi:DNA-binding MarR family transcriptional regulator